MKKHLSVTFRNVIYRARGRAAERGGGGGRGQIAPGPQVLKAQEIFCWAPVIFLGEIFPRKGQDIFWGAKYRNLVGKIEVKSLQRTHPVEKKFEIGAPKKNLSRAPAKLSAALVRGIIATERCCFAQLLKVVHSVSDGCFFVSVQKAISCIM